ncbi:unnamed protein product [Echinostoma caproni]|uniref:Uncharacterized protein n=1 Tax=Echinostoma caproni TaxID=27848 RepID=A0A183AJA1_9TREM|nr:unnamed protein product [Echinostoma caproni]
MTNTNFSVLNKNESLNSAYSTKRWSGEYPFSTSRTFSSHRPSQLKIGLASTNGTYEPRSTGSSLRPAADGKSPSLTDDTKQVSPVVPRPEVVLSKSPTLATQEQSDSDLGEQSSATSVNLRRSSSGRSRLSGFSFSRFRRTPSSAAVKRAQSFDQPSTSPSPASAVVSLMDAVRPNRISIECATERDEAVPTTTTTTTEKQNDSQSITLPLSFSTKPGQNMSENISRLGTLQSTQ